jgi:GNAT superfamily N-acetyltransferase
MNSILRDLSPSKVLLAYDVNDIAYYKFFSRLPQAELHDEPGMLWLATDSDADRFNCVLHTQLEPDRLPAAIDRIRSYFQQCHRPSLWLVGPSSRPSNLRQILTDHGLTHYETEPIMAVDLLHMNEDIPASSRLATQPVTTREQLWQWMRVWLFDCSEEIIQQCFALYSGLPLDLQNPLRLYLGTLDGKPVATSAVFFGGGVACIGPVVTLPQARRQGIGAAMTLVALREARAQEYRISALTASPMGINIYRRIGFQEYGTFSVYCVTL